MLLLRSHRIALAVLLVALALGAIYLWRGPGVLAEVQQLGGQLWKSATRPAPPSAEEKQAARRGPDSKPRPAAAQMRKCIRGQNVTYTNEPCPAGSREEQVQDQLNVLHN